MTKANGGHPQFVQMPRKPTEKQLGAVMRETGLSVEKIFAVYRAMIDAFESEGSKGRKK